MKKRCSGSHAILPNGHAKHSQQRPVLNNGEATNHKIEPGRQIDLFFERAPSVQTENVARRTWLLLAA